MAEQEKINVLIVEDDPDFCFLIKDCLKKENDMTVCGTASSPAQALILAQAMEPDIVLMDLNLTASNLDGIQAAKMIRISTDAKVLILTAFENPQIITDACRRSFASGYIFKSQFSLLLETIRKTAGGHTPQEHLIASLILSELSPAEYSIFELLMGKDLKLQSSPKTIANQKNNLLKKLGLANQSELIHIFKGLTY